MQLKQQSLMHNSQKNSAVSFSQKPIQRLQVIDSNFSRTNDRANSAWIEIALDGTLDPENKPTAADELELSRGQMTQDLQLGTNEPKACHLVNGKLGGPGDDAGNLGWGNTRLNNNHRSIWEDSAKEAAADPANDGKIMTVSVDPVYRHDDANNRDAAFYMLKNIYCHWVISDENGGLEETDIEKITSGKRTNTPYDRDYQGPPIAGGGAMRAPSGRARKGINRLDL